MYVFYHIYLKSLMRLSIEAIYGGFLVICTSKLFDHYLHSAAKTFLHNVSNSKKSLLCSLTYFVFHKLAKFYSINYVIFLI